MKNFQKSISLLFILFIVVAIGLFHYSSDTFLALNMWLIIIISLISIFLTWRQLFLVVLTTILIVGFSIFFITNQTLSNQYELIGEHVLLSASLLLVWVMATVLKRMETVLQHQRETIKKLEKYQGSTEILSNDEFRARVKLITKATDRRNAKNMVIEFTISTIKTTEKAMHGYVAETILNTTRNEYDLVTKSD